MNTLSEKQVTIYCSSSNNIPENYFLQTEKTIKALVENGYAIRYGGGGRGLMGTVADTVLKYEGKITGVIPRFMIEREWEHKGITNMIHVDTMHERKVKLIENSCAVLALPGGLGTLDELVDVLSLKNLGFFPYPVIILNVNGFYNAFIELTKRMIEQHFLEISGDDLWTIAFSPEDVIKTLENDLSK